MKKTNVIFILMAKAVKTNLFILIGVVILAGLVFKLFQGSPKNENEPNLNPSQVSSSLTENNSTSSNDNESNNDKINKEDTKSDLGIEILRQGTGEGVKNGQGAIVHYVGILQDGTKFDSSYDRGLPLRFTLGQGLVIEGWDKGILGMKVGEKRKLTIPPELAYGSSGAGGVIPPNATLIFEVELLQIDR